MKEVTLIYPHQLFDKHPALLKERKIYLVEEPLLMGEFPIHAQKMLLHHLSVHAYREKKEQEGYDIHIIERDSIKNTASVFARLYSESVTTIHIVDTTDQWLEKRIKEAKHKYGFECVRYGSPMFILEKQEAQERYLASKRHMAYFYKKVRIDKNILMDGSDPIGGKWSFDYDNRKKIPKDYILPADILFLNNQEINDARLWLKELDVKTYGEDNVWIPYTHKDAQQWLDEFLRDRFSDFGFYEDAISGAHTRVNHSVLSPLLNCGLLTPKDVINRTMSYAQEHKIPINSLEGFVRQIIGWREFMRASYEVDGVSMRNKNFFNHHKKLSAAWWNATTGIMPLDTSIKRSLTYGYTHHIERLMVIGNIMLLSSIDPSEVYSWFMAMYVDAYDWVMVPNVYGMSQFSDGGSFATKPYIAGANYIKKMSDYKKGLWEDTVTGLYWNFVSTHREIFKSNHRMSMMPRLWENMNEEKQQAHIMHAKGFINKV